MCPALSEPGHGAQSRSVSLSLHTRLVLLTALDPPRAGKREIYIGLTEALSSVFHVNINVSLPFNQVCFVTPSGG